MCLSPPVAFGLQLVLTMVLRNLQPFRGPQCSLIRVDCSRTKHPWSTANPVVSESSGRLSGPKMEVLFLPLRLCGLITRPGEHPQPTTTPEQVARCSLPLLLVMDL
jgi:hypothetical protein